MKTLGVVVGVFIVWCIVAFIVMFQQHIGQTYDPTFGGAGAWFTDPSKDDAAAAWIGSAIMYGVFVSLGAGLLYWFKNRTVAPEGGA